jgi:two-component system sensor histidine kinase MtrB
VKVGEGIASSTLTIWRRNLQLRLVTVTVLASALVIGIVGALLMTRVASGLLETKRLNSLNESTVARQEVQNVIDGATFGPAQPDLTELTLSIIDVLQVRAGTPGYYDAVILPDPSLVGTPQATTSNVSENSVPLLLREQLWQEDKQVWSYTTIRYADGRKVAGLIVGDNVAISRVGAYEVYLLFPLTNEQRSIDLVRSSLWATGLALLVGLGVLALFVTARVTEPVRQAALVAQDLAAGNLDRRLAVLGEDDLARLAASFNAMADSLQNQINRLETLSQLQQQFVSDVSHELRTPLTTVRMASELIYNARATLNPEMARCAELLQGQVERFFHLLNDLLEISRFDASAGVLEATTIEMVALTQSVVDENAQIASAHGTSLEFMPHQSLAFAQGDSRRLSRIIRNLIANAIEHSEGRPVVIEVDSNEEAVSIGVRDFGSGISEENLERIFGRFWRADPSRTRTLGGSGLGLAISVEDARLHGGTLKVWGRPAQGAHFVLTVPRRIGMEVITEPIVPSAPQL